MPICQMKTNFRMTQDTRKAFLDETAKELSEILKKPLPAVMLMLDDAHMYMNQSEDTVFFAEFRYILPEEYLNAKSAFLKEFADRMLTLFQKYTRVDPYRIYMQFTEMNREGAWRYTR